jgi:hypothetical protein
LNALKGSRDKEILDLLTLLKPGFKVEENQDDFDFLVKTKCRFVDPEFFEDDSQELVRLSTVDSHFKELIEEHQARVKAGYPIKIVR